MTDITLPRATVEQALEALAVAWRQNPHWQITESMRALRDALAQPSPATLAEPVEVPHRHEWFSTGGMEPGQMRCIHCGAWGRSTATLIDPRGSLGEPIV